MHKSVLLHESINALAIKSDGVYVDGTFGRGGHAREILKSLASNGKLIVVDKDAQALEVAHDLAQNDSRVLVYYSSFADIDLIAKEFDVVGKIDGILLDLGVSSPQLDQADRGFSFMQDGPLDMRMDNNSGQSVAQFLQTVDEKLLADIIWRYGEERFSRRIAKNIIEARAQSPIVTTHDLVKIIEKSIPYREKHKHPATRTFMALRIFINRELEDLQVFLDKTYDVLAIGARLAIISFHSLEDRMVKQFFMKQLRDDLPRGLPIKSDATKAKFKWVSKKLRATEDERNNNIRSRSAILRVVEKSS